MRSRKENIEFNWLSLIPAVVFLLSVYPSLEKGIHTLAEACHHTPIITISILF
jgi:hypothetical protein